MGKGYLLGVAQIQDCLSRVVGDWREELCVVLTITHIGISITLQEATFAWT